MKALIAGAIHRPIAVLSAVMAVVLFGLLALQTIPIQLTPDISKPRLSIRTNWPGAAPADVEREIVTRQEDAFKGLEGVESMSASAGPGRATLTLEFGLDQNMDKAILLVSNRLAGIDGYPDEAGVPIIRTADSNDSPIAWFHLKRLDGSQAEMHEYGDIIRDVIQDRLERVNGVALVNVYGGAEKQIRLTVDPVRMARQNITVTDIVTALRRANLSLSAGDVEEGKRRYLVRSEGALDNFEAIRNVVIVRRQDAVTGRAVRVSLSDIADIEQTWSEPTSSIRQLGTPSIALNAVRETGANVIEVMEGIRQAVDSLNEEQLKYQGLFLKQVYDETVYIDSAINLVQQNIWVGGVLAAIILMLFLRSGGATSVISLAIPVSVVGSFVAMAAMGRSINVISLAGIAFAVGMVVDAAIVVLENIYRLRQQGAGRIEAAYRGAFEMWGAIFVSALTTVLVFVPILVMKLEVGQLFRDIAVAISVSVLLSLIVAVTVVPALARRLLADDLADKQARRRLPGIDHAATAFVSLMTGLARVMVKQRSVAALIVVLLTGAAGLVSWLLLPPLDYLPNGNRNLVFGRLMAPPGYNLDTLSEIAFRAEDKTRPYWGISQDAGIENDGKYPTIEEFFFVAFGNFIFMGATAEDANRVDELVDLLQSAKGDEVGGFVGQSSLFGRSVGGSRTVELEITGTELEPMLAFARKVSERLHEAMPKGQRIRIYPRPALELAAPELRLIPDRANLADVGMSATDLAMSVDVFNDGMRVAEITYGGERMDLVLAGPDNLVRRIQELGNLPIVTPGGDVVPASALSDIVLTAGPSEISRSEGMRAVSLFVRPGKAMPLEVAMDLVQRDVIDHFRAEGLPPGVGMQLTGTADKLTQTFDAMIYELLFALAIVYLVMAVLFESFIYPLIIMISVPVAAAGGVLGLVLMNLAGTQPLDMLTMLGFVILIGIVVNNAILLVHQTLHHVREEGMEPGAAIVEATRNRIRPIFMSTLTSVFGMVPLVLFPGAGSELYRGLGSVVLGGLSLSAILTLVLVPALTALCIPLMRRQMKTTSVRA